MLALFISLQSYSQEFIYRRGLATLSIGTGVPGYDFGKQSGIYLSSYAKLGTSITGEVSYFYNWNVGINFMITYNVNPVDEGKLAAGYMLESPAFHTVNAKSEAFRDIAGLGGMVFDVPINDYFSVTFKTMMGLRNIYKPTASIETTTVFSEVNYYETHDNKLVFAFLFATGARVYVNDLFNVHLNFSYMGSTMNFEYLRNNKEISQEVHIGVLSIQAGVSYAL